MTHQEKSLSNVWAFVAGVAVWALFGNKIRGKLSESEGVQQLKSEIESGYSKAKDKTQEAYNQVVDEVTDKYAKVRGISKNELVDLTDDLKSHWSRIKQAWND